MAWEITRNLTFEAYLYTDTVVSKVEYFHRASAAWREYKSHHPERAGSCDFARGFRNGYAEFLEWGGSELPPPSPPRRYWKIRYQNKQGRMATAMWGAGYKEGASTAKASGVRDYIVVPYNNVVPPETPPAAVSGPIAPIPQSAAPAAAPASELPPPRPAAKESLPAPINKSDSNPAEPQIGLDQHESTESDGGHNAQIIMTDEPLSPATLNSPRALPPRDR